MKTITIGHENGKRLFKLQYTPEEIENIQVYKAQGVFYGSPLSNIALGCIPAHINGTTQQDLRMLERFSDRCAVTGAWSTTSGAKYVFSNILANPNITKLVLYCEKRDNTHFLLDACIQFWKHGTNRNGMIKGAKAMNPRFDLPLEALERLRKQVDLVVLRNLSDYTLVERVLHSCYQEPEHAVSCSSLGGVDCYPSRALYDGGARFMEPYFVQKSYVHEEGIYHFSDVRQFVQTLPQIIFQRGIMERTRSLSTYAAFSPSENYDYYAVRLPLFVARVCSSHRQRTFLSSRALAGAPRLQCIAQDEHLCVLKAHGCCVASMDMYARVLKKGAVLQALARACESLIVLKNAKILVRGDKH